MAIELNMNTRETTRQFNRSHGSFELALAPVILGLLGLWLDKSIGTTPVFVVSLAIFGFVGAFLKTYYSYRYEMAQHEAKLNDLRTSTKSPSVADKAVAS